MKKVFSNNEVTHIWAQQTQSEGRGSNIFFEGATIYSYGKHFPIATIEGNDVLFTLDSYSSTTAAHISRARSAISHKNIIWCKAVPVKYWKDDRPLNKQEFTRTHEINTNYWKNKIKALFDQLGNKKNRDIRGRIGEVSRQIEQLNRYYAYFGLKVKDAELKSLLTIATKPDFVEKAREAKVKQDATNERKMKQATKAYETYISLWRNYDDEGLKNLPLKTKDLCNFYRNKSVAFTRLRFNSSENRLETSKGVQIPAKIAKRAYVALNGCMEGSCNSLSIPVMNYTITETGKDYIKAGCHTIPKDDVRYIAELLKW